MDLFLAVPGRADAVRADRRSLRPVRMVDKHHARAAADACRTYFAVFGQRHYHWAAPSEGQEMNCMKDKQNKIVRDKVRTNNVSQAAHIVKIAEKQKDPDNFLQPGARKISVRP